MNNKIIDKKQNNSILILRVFAMVLILACHLVQEHSNIYIRMTAQFFNVGVSIFILISGYLYGSKKINNSYGNWIITRVKRIIIPLYVFMAYLLFVDLIKGNTIKIINWIAYILNVQGFQIYVHGAEHLWYLTVIMICYLITPILDRNREKLNVKNINILLSTLISIQILTTYLINNQLGIYLTYILIYIVSYIVGYKGNILMSNKKLYLAIGLVFASIFIRFIGKFILDNTDIYDVIIVGYTQAIIAFAMFYIFYYLGDKIIVNRFMKFIDSISYEIYLVHYMYIVGPLRVFGITGKFLLDICIVLVVSFVSAIVLNKICKKIYILIN